MTDSAARPDIARLLDIMRQLRDPDTGCPWDVAQDFASIAPYTIEEAYEVAGAIAERNWHSLKDELGDLLLQVVFHARMAEERNLFDFKDVVGAILDKMIRRHPHVFAAGGGIDSAAAQTIAWEEHKSRERADRPGGILDDVPEALPALLRAVKLQKRAASVGFDWDSVPRVLAKIAEEAEEIAAARAGGASEAEVAGEFGDLLFAVVNLARHLHIDAESALRTTNAKFVRRFRTIEQGLAKEGKTPATASLDEMEQLWQAAKRMEG